MENVPTAPAATSLLRTPLYQYHLDQGAKLVPYAGWEMPLHYGSILDEHRLVRETGGIFDVSHMGRFEITGKDSCRFLDRVCTRQVHGMSDGQARYSIVCNEAGGCHDDVLVYRKGDDNYLMVCNAANREKLLGHFDAVKNAEGFVFALEDITLKSAMIALQGPKVMELISGYSSEIPNLKRYRFTMKSVMGLEIMVSRTGYTGEDGVEAIFRTDGAMAKTALSMVIKQLSNGDSGLGPAGLGARDSLRLEAAMALYGHEITEELDPVSANLGFAMKLTKGDDNPEIGRFIGQDALQKIAADGPKRKLVGLELDTPRAARQDMNVLDGDATVGIVTSGVMSPTLGKSIAMAYVDAAKSELGTTLTVDLGRQQVPAKIVELPFLKK